jgi:uncharacterized membrane protein
VETSRLEAFADGIFAIAATLLILDVSVDAPDARLGTALVHAWPEYAAYAVSFLTIGIMWINHHEVMRQVGRADRTFLALNIVLLTTIAFVPFPTRLVADHLRDAGAQAAALTYGCTMVAEATCWAAVWFYAASGRRLIAAEADERHVNGITRAFVPGVPTYLAATLVALWSPHVALALFAAIAVFYLLESSLLARTT